LSKADLAGAIDVCSNHYLITFTPDQLRKLAIPGDHKHGSSKAVSYRAQALPKRLGAKKVEDIFQRYGSGESATMIAKDLGVAPSALLRLLSEKKVVVRKHGLTPQQDAALAREYEAGSSMAELEKKHQLSHSTVSRALHRSGAEIRNRGRRVR
jgi:hypothetical protein